MFMLRNSWLIVLFVSVSCFAQDTDLVRIEYAHIPQYKSDNSVNRYRAFINAPIRINNDTDYLILGLEYRYSDLDFNDPVPFDVNNLETFQLFRGSLAYTFMRNGPWRYAAKIGIEINSNFENSSITNDDTNITGAAFMIKDISGDSIAKPSRLIIGLNYSTNQGRPYPLPVINYYKKFHPNWSYSLGTPKTNLKYFVDKRNAVQGFITLDGFYSNIQNNLAIDSQDPSSPVANNISMTLVLAGLGYEYNFTKHLVFYAYGGHTLYNEIRLRDLNRKNLYKINQENTFYFRSGIKFKI